MVKEIESRKQPRRASVEAELVWVPQDGCQCQEAGPGRSQDLGMLSGRRDGCGALSLLSGSAGKSVAAHRKIRAGVRSGKGGQLWSLLQHSSDDFCGKGCTAGCWIEQGHCTWSVLGKKWVPSEVG